MSVGSLLFAAVNTPAVVSVKVAGTTTEKRSALAVAPTPTLSVDSLLHFLLSSSYSPDPHNLLLHTATHNSPRSTDFL